MKMKGYEVFMTDYYINYSAILKTYSYVIQSSALNQISGFDFFEQLTEWRCRQFMPRERVRQ